MATRVAYPETEAIIPGRESWASVSIGSSHTLPSAIRSSLRVYGSASRPARMHRAKALGVSLRRRARTELKSSASHCALDTHVEATGLRMHRLKSSASHCGRAHAQS